MEEFQYILLSKTEYRLLLKSRVEKVPEDMCKSLLYYHLVDCIKSAEPGGMPVSTGFCKINDNGERYILYKIDSRKIYLKDKWIDILAAGIAVASFIMSLCALLAQ